MIARVFAFVLVAFAASVAHAQSPEQLAAADRMMAAQDVEAMMKDMTSNMSKQMPENVRAAFVAEMTDKAFMGRYKERMRTVMAQTFTVDEMNALADFYSKPIAKTAMAKMGGMMAQIMPFLQGEMPAMMKRIDEKMKQAAPK